MGKFILKRSKNEQFFFNLLATNGQIILTSEMYTTKASAENGIESIKTNAGEDGRYERLESEAGWRFNLKARNGQVIGSSQVYKSLDSRENGIESVKKNAPEAPTIEELD